MTIHTGMVGFIERRGTHFRVGAVALAVFACAGLCVTIGTQAGVVPLGQRPGLVLSLIASAALFLARRHPRTATVVATTCVTAACALGYLPTPLLLAPLIGTLYWLAIVDSTRS